VPLAFVRRMLYEPDTESVPSRAADKSDLVVPRPIGWISRPWPRDWNVRLISRHHRAIRYSRLRALPYVTQLDSADPRLIAFSCCSGDKSQGHVRNATDTCARFVPRNMATYATWKHQHTVGWRFLLSLRGAPQVRTTGTGASGSRGHMVPFAQTSPRPPRVAGPLRYILSANSLRA